MRRSAREHWDTVYVSKAPGQASWFQAWPQPSLRLLSSVAAPRSVVLDVGAGTSTLTDALVGAGWSDVTVLDVSAEALAVVRARLGARRHDVSFVVGDVLSWQPERTYDVWHDRAVFHFLVQPDERARYVATAGVLWRWTVRWSSEPSRRTVRRSAPDCRPLATAPRSSPTPLRRRSK